MLKSGVSLYVETTYGPFSFRAELRDDKRTVFITIKATLARDAPWEHLATCTWRPDIRGASGTAGVLYNPSYTIFGTPEQVKAMLELCNTKVLPHLCQGIREAL